MKLVGLTGGIGSGKTTVAGFFKDLDVPVYIADDQAKILTENSRTIQQGIVAAFGEALYDDGKLNRKMLASIVFNDQAKLAQLNAIIHPEVRRNFEVWKTQKSNTSAPYIVYEAAILFETGAYRNFDYNILVTADREERIRRLMARDGSTQEEVLARMDNQWSDEQKRELADFEIVNMQRGDTRSQVWEIHKKFTEKG